MIRWLKEKLAALRASEEQKRVDAGFSWAAGELLMGQDRAAAFIEDICFGEAESDPFYRGALEAITRARQVGLIRNPWSPCHAPH